ncbi:DMT family transporter [Ascidiaceihabitans sp.]|uniref:DMT family transporter n=1 Tax=Ascidiaceihabitans sp. TaxID=1872644 RepID=UPI00329A0929
MKTNRDNLVGSLWMIAAMAGFAVEDSFVKAATKTLPVAQVLVLFGLGGALVFALNAFRLKDPLFSKAVISPSMLVRVCFEITGRLFYVLALAYASLSSATVILQATPLVVIAFAALFMGETVGWRRWTAIFMGLLGVLVILNPSADSFTWASLLAVVGLLGFAGRDLASRATPASLSTSVLGVYGFMAVAVAGGLYFLWEGRGAVALSPVVAWTMTGAVGAGVLAYACLMKAMRTGEVAAVTPFRYTRLLFGIGAAVFWFGETITANMVVGSGLIVLSGLFILLRGASKSAA